MRKYLIRGTEGIGISVSSNSLEIPAREDMLGSRSGLSDCIPGKYLKQIHLKIIRQHKFEKIVFLGHSISHLSYQRQGLCQYE